MEKACESHYRARKSWTFHHSTPAFYRMDRGVITYFTDGLVSYDIIYRPKSRQGDLSISGMHKCRQSGMWIINMSIKLCYCELWLKKLSICQKDLDAVFSHVVQFSAVYSRCSVPVVRSLAPGTGAGSGGTTLAAGQHCCFCHYTVVQWHSDIYKLLGCHKYREVVSFIK